MLVADISYSTVGLLLKLYDASLGNPTTWSWDIRNDSDTSVHAATTPTTEFTFTVTGTYKILLTVHNEVVAEPDSLTTIHVRVDATADTILYDISIIEMVSNLVPPAIMTANVDLVQDLKYKWQEILYQGLNVLIGSAHNEDEWPTLGNLLIAYLIARDFIINEANAILLQTSSAGGGTKKIVTGPTEAERFQASSVYKEMFGSDGAYEEFTNQICGLAARLQVAITGCKNSFPAPIKVFYNGDVSYQHKFLWDLPEFYMRHNSSS